MAHQQELALPWERPDTAAPHVPARMLNEYVYCPRLAYLEWVQGEWADSADTVEGRYGHRRVDSRTGSLPPPDELSHEQQLHARSVTLSSDALGLVAKLDLIESDGARVTPVDYKRGRRPHVANSAYDPERVQLCAQGLLLEAHGYDCQEGVLYFIASKERVTVEFDEALRELTRRSLGELQLLAHRGEPPPPLQDSPKCPRCSLVAICLPDELNHLNAAGLQPRPISVPRDDALPMYVQATGAKVAKSGETLVVTVKDEKQATARIVEVSQLSVFGNVYVTTPALHELMRRDIPVSWFSYGGWFLGHSTGTGHKNVEVRTAQYRASFDGGVCLRLARDWIQAKIVNCRVMLRRNWKSDGKNKAILDGLSGDIRTASVTESLDSLLGVEGAAAARYFASLPNMLRQRDEREPQFDFEHRNRRPPTDPVNAMLSFAYALLTRACTVALSGVGLDPYRGFYHQPRYGRPALSLDFMEPFRPLIADSVVVSCINNDEVRPTDFVRAAGRVNLNDAGRKRFIGAFERRMSQEVTHPVFGYRVSYRRLLDVQARLLCRHLLGEIPSYPNFTTR